MQVRKFEARSMKEALEMVKFHMGPEAIILSAKENYGSLTGKYPWKIILKKYNLAVYCMRIHISLKINQKICLQ